jgi:hypothetical protein
MARNPRLGPDGVRHGLLVALSAVGTCHAERVRCGPVGLTQADVTFVLGDGTERRVPLDPASAPEPLEMAAPVRSFPSFRGQRNFPGLWWSATSGRHVGFESWLERDHDHVGLRPRGRRHRLAAVSALVVRGTAPLSRPRLLRPLGRRHRRGLRSAPASERDLPASRGLVAAPCFDHQSRRSQPRFSETSARRRMLLSCQTGSHPRAMKLRGSGGHRLAQRRITDASSRRHRKPPDGTETPRGTLRRDRFWKQISATPFGQTLPSRWQLPTSRRSAARSRLAPRRRFVGGSDTTLR